MGLRRPTPASVDAYLSALPPVVRQRLGEIRETIRRVAPDAGEAISYGIPAFTLAGSPFIYYAGFDKHVSVYPVPLDHPDLRAQLASYASGKATARFPVDAPIPTDIVARVAHLMLERQAARVRARKRKSNPKRGEG